MYIYVEYVPCRIPIMRSCKAQLQYIVVESSDDQSISKIQHGEDKVRTLNRVFIYKTSTSSTSYYLDRQKIFSRLRITQPIQLPPLLLQRLDNPRGPPPHRLLDPDQETDRALALQGVAKTVAICVVTIKQIS